MCTPRIDSLQDHRRVDLEGELWRAIEIGRRVDLIEAAGIAPALMTVVGVDFVRFHGRGRREMFYEPAEDGAAALIVGAVDHDEDDCGDPIAIDLGTGIGVAEIVEGGVIADLVAIELEGRRVGSRLGWATALGTDAIEASRWRGMPLTLMTPLRWLREPEGTASVIDWRRAVYSLQDCAKITCDSLALADRVRAAFARPIPLPPLYVEIAT